MTVPKSLPVSPKWTLLIAVGALVLWFSPVPAGLNERAWHLFAIFIAAIAAVIVNAMPIFLAAILALSLSVLTGTLAAKEAFSGLSEDFLLLIISAFLLARVMIKSGLGTRIAYLVIRKLGKSTLGLGYSIFLTDAIIAPAFPSNTARSGVLFPIIQSICIGSGSDPAAGTEKKLGHFLMMSGIASLAVSSGLWLTAMAVNPVGAAMVEKYGVTITFGSWFLHALAPSLVAMAALPFLLLRFMDPEVKRTPRAPEIASQALSDMGKMTRQERWTAAIFLFLVLAWAAPVSFGINRAAAAFLGIAFLMLLGVYSVGDLKKEGEALEILIWFGSLYALSSYLNELGFMGWLGERVAHGLAGASVPVVYVVLVLSYIAIHYLFVSQSAHLLAVAPVFFSVAASAGVPMVLAGYMILFATNFFSALTPQASSSNVLFTGSGYLTLREVYGYGGLVTAVCTLIFLTLGSAWILLLGP